MRLNRQMYCLPAIIRRPLRYKCVERDQPRLIIAFEETGT